jgi:anti-anti-sigma regulatory factor
MPFEIQTTEAGLLLELTGAVTARYAGELGKCLASSLETGKTVTVKAGKLDDIDTSILQLLVSLRKTAAGFVLQEFSEAFGSAMDRCALRRELLSRERL